MATRILFSYKLHQELVDIMFNAGFELVKKVESPFEILRYERVNPSTLKPDIIQFWGLENWHENSILADAATAVGKGFWLKNLKELLPGYQSLPVSEEDNWTFDNEQQLSICLAEIADLVQNRLMAWFDKPTMNPSGMDMEPKVKLSPEEFQAGLKEQIRLANLAAQNARKEGRIKDAQRWERTLQHYQSLLAE